MKTHHPGIHLTPSRLICLLVLLATIIAAPIVRAQSIDVPPQLSDLPTVYIDTYDGFGVWNKTDYQYATYREVADGKVTTYDSLRIRGRGNSTWNLEKKPYRLKFNEKVRLLGKNRANAKNWVLVANHADKTMLRNAVASFIGTFLGQPFTPGVRYVDLVLDGDYIGTYQITDHLDIRKNRINITEQDTPPAPDDDITGGYLIEFDGFYSSADVYFKTTRSTPVSIHSPDEDIITKEQIAYIRDVVQKIENALFSSRYTDPEQGYRSLVDTTTLASWFVASDYTANPDAFWSTYAYKQAGDPLLYWGPMWDYDIAFNNCNRCGDVTTRTITDYAFGSAVIQPWAKRLVTDPWFQRLTARTWQEASKEGICQATLAYIDSLATVIDSSQRLNFERYRIDKRVYNEITLYSTYQEGVDYLKRFVKQHADFLDEYYGVVREPDPPFTIDTSCYYLITNVGNAHPVDIENDLLCTWHYDEERADSQQWELHAVPEAEGYYNILSRGSGLAITDNSQKEGEGYVKGTQLELNALSADDLAQQWRFVPTSGYFAIENRLTEQAWNNRSGASADGNHVISWYNNAENVQKVTRQWKLTQQEPILTDLPLLTIEEPDHRLVYDRDTETLHLLIPFDVTTKGMLSVVSTTGITLASTTEIQAPLVLNHLPAGIYIAVWQVGPRKHTLRFRKP